MSSKVRLTTTISWFALPPWFCCPFLCSPLVSANLSCERICNSRNRSCLGSLKINAISALSSVDRESEKWNRIEYFDLLFVLDLHLLTLFGVALCRLSSPRFALLLFRVPSFFISISYKIKRVDHTHICVQDHQCLLPSLCFILSIV